MLRSLKRNGKKVFKQWRLHNCGNTTEATTLLQQFIKEIRKPDTHLPVFFIGNGKLWTISYYIFLFFFLGKLTDVHEAYCIFQLFFIFSSLPGDIPRALFFFQYPRPPRGVCTVNFTF